MTKTIVLTLALTAVTCKLYRVDMSYSCMYIALIICVMTQTVMSDVYGLSAYSCQLYCWVYSDLGSVISALRLET